MFKVISIKSAILSLGISTIILPILIINISLANERSYLLLNKNQQQKSVPDVMNGIFRRRGKTSPRGPETICFLWPDPKDEEQVTWSDRPTFAWKGRVKHIAIRPYGKFSIVWERDIDTTTEFFPYPDKEKPLERGKEYDYVLTYENDKRENEKFDPIPFTVMDDKNLEFTNIAKFIEGQKSETQAESLALQQAEYFQSKYFNNDPKINLKADEVRLLLSIKTNNSQLNNAIKAEITKECKNREKLPQEN